MSSKSLRDNASIIMTQKLENNENGSENGKATFSND